MDKPDLKPQLEKVASNVREFLTTSKAFEYNGPLELKYGAQIKLLDLKLDMDDVIRNMMGKRTDIGIQVQLSMIVLPPVKGKVEPNPEPKVEVVPVSYSEYCE